MISRVVKYMLHNSSSEMHVSVVIVSCVAIFVALISLLNLIFEPASWHSSLKLGGYCIGSVGFGELARLIVKSKLDNSMRYKSMCTTAIAGGATGLLYSSLLALKGSTHIYGIAVSVLVGVCFYSFMAHLFQLHLKHDRALNKK